MLFISLLFLAGMLVIAAFAVCDYLFGRFGRKSKLRLDGTYRAGNFKVYVVSFKPGTVMSRPVLFDEAKQLGLTAAREEHMLALKEARLPFDRWISSEIEAGKVLTIFTRQRPPHDVQVCDVLPFTQFEYYAFVDERAAEEKRSEAAEPARRTHAVC